MIASLKSEFRKLLTVRSTYIILAFVVILEIFFAFYISGWRIDRLDLLNPQTLAGDVTSAVNAVSVFAALAAVLLMTHEYRYNTIMYTLTSSNSRSRSLLAKAIVITVFAIVFTLVFGAISPLMAILGIHAHHLKLVPQTLDYGNLLWRSLFFGWGYVMAGLAIALLVKNQVGAIIILFVAPGTIESLLGLLLKRNVVYLPFSALHVVIGHGMDSMYNNAITVGHAALVFMGYLVLAWLIGWILFLKRDAN